MPLARIYKPTKTTMQSGQGRAREWILEIEPGSARTPDPLTGWTSTTDLNGQIRLSFETSDEAVAYAKKHGIGVQLFPANERRLIIKAYADNFAADRKQPWSH